MNNIFIVLYTYELYNILKQNNWLKMNCLKLTMHDTLQFITIFFGEHGSDYNNIVKVQFSQTLCFLN